jgi:hypothetical protein
MEANVAAVAFATESRAAFVVVTESVTESTAAPS